MNDRDDLAGDGTFASFSPTRHSFLIQGDWYTGRDWTLTAGGEYVKSNYSNQNRLLDSDGQFKIQSRNSDHIGFWLKARYDLTARWHILGEYRYDDKDDNFQTYNYNRSEFKVTVGFVF